MSARDLVAFGEVLWDIFSTEPDVFRREIGGAPANVCVQVARLGGHASVVGAVGADVFGEALSAKLAAEGVDVRALVRRPERTGIAFVLRTAAGQPRFLFYRHATADMAFTSRDLPRSFPRARYALVGSSTLVRPELAKATFDFIAQASRARARLVVDLNVRAHLWKSRAAVCRAVASLLAHADLVKASADDLDALEVGAEARAIAWVRRRAPKAAVLVTRGSKSSSAFGEFDAVDVAAQRSRCVDATGAGDAFLAGAIRVLAQVASPPSRAAYEAALTVGNAMGGRVVRGVGAVSADTRSLRPTLERAMRKLAQNESKR